ncbi:MAG: hypothetical protein ABEH38_01920 [Flavobacteriales bacterium]
MIGFLLLSVILGTSCSKYYGCDPELDCQEQEPKEGKVRIRITAPARGDTVRVEIRRGSWSDGKVIHNGPAFQKELLFHLPVRHRYTVEAHYSNGKSSLRAYDSGRLDVKDLRNCDEVCFQVEPLALDLQRGD